MFQFLQSLTLRFDCAGLCGSKSGFFCFVYIVSVHSFFNHFKSLFFEIFSQHKKTPPKFKKHPPRTRSGSYHLTHKQVLLPFFITWVFLRGVFFKTPRKSTPDFKIRRKYTKNVDRKPLKDLSGPGTFQEPSGGFPETFY